ncbi:MAG: phage holin [Clostridia bacterium]|nr:phage holin [Clostridia bacterium]
MSRLKNYNFWISMVSAILLVLQNLFDMKVDVAFVNEAVSSVLGILVVIGIINDPTKSKKLLQNDTEVKISSTLTDNTENKNTDN